MSASPSASTRRDFLRLAGAAGGALVLGASWHVSPAREPAHHTSSENAATGLPLTAWVRVASSGEITLVASQSEMGQGISTTLAAALAHELYVPLDSVRIEFAPFRPDYRDPVYNWMFTGNSQGTSSFYDIMRTMGAAAREMLFAAAAARLGVPEASLSTRGGIIHTPTRSVSFGDLAVAASTLPVPSRPKPRDDAPFAGQSVARWDIPAKVDGSAVFGIDVKVPGMLLAAVRCAPRFGSQLAHFDHDLIRAQPGVVAVVAVPRGLAVVAKTYWQARQALDSARLEWSAEGSTLSCSQSLPAVYREKLASGPFFVHKTTGSVDNAMASASRRIEATYEIPFQAHATMEPMNCTAHITAERCEIWAPTQGMEMAHQVAMRVTGLAADRIAIHRTLLGGGFGRRLLADFLMQTLIIAKTVQQPVKLIWSREEDMTHDFYRPAMLHHVAGAVDASGAPVSLAHRVVSPSHMLYIVPRAYFPQLEDWTAPAALPEAMDTMAVEGLLDAPYEIPNQRIEQHRLELDVPVSVWRTTGHGPNNFVLESFFDELASAAQVDPIAFRLAAAQKNPRACALLDLVRQKSGWSQPLPAGAGRGVALSAAFGALIATVVELSVAGSRVKVRRVVTAVDCGRTLDPRIATSNILGGIVWGLSGLKTSMPFASGRPVHVNFDGFEPIYLRDTPPCEVHFIESGAKLGGTGELGAVPVHAAACNAIFAATGKRIRALPLSNSGLSFA